MDDRRLNDWDAEFTPLLEGTFSMFVLDDTKDEEDGENKSDIEKIYLAGEKIKDARKRTKETVDAARDDLRNLSRVYEQQKSASTRSNALPSASEHEARMLTAQADRLAILKQNVDLEQTLYRCQGELERLQQELKDEEGDAVEVTELNSEVLRIKVYRDLGFTPIEENGIFSKVLVRSSNTSHAATIQLDSKSSDFFWANLLWDQLGV